MNRKELLENYNAIDYNSEDINLAYEQTLREMYFTKFGKEQKNIAKIYDKLVSSGVNMKEIQKIFLEETKFRRDDYMIKKTNAIEIIKEFLKREGLEKTKEVNCVSTLYFKKAAERRVDMLIENGVDAEIITKENKYVHVFNGENNIFDAYEIWANITETDYKLLAISQ